MSLSSLSWHPALSRQNSFPTWSNSVNIDTVEEGAEVGPDSCRSHCGPVVQRAGRGLQCLKLTRAKGQECPIDQLQHIDMACFELCNSARGFVQEHYDYSRPGPQKGCVNFIQMMWAGSCSASFPVNVKTWEVQSSRVQTL